MTKIRDAMSDIVDVKCTHVMSPKSGGLTDYSIAEKLKQGPLGIKKDGNKRFVLKRNKTKPKNPLK